MDAHYGSLSWFVPLTLVLGLGLGGFYATLSRLFKRGNTHSLWAYRKKASFSWDLAEVYGDVQPISSIRITLIQNGRNILYMPTETAAPMEEVHKTP